MHTDLANNPTQAAIAVPPRAAVIRSSLRVWLDAYRRALLVSDAYRQLRCMRDEDLAAVGLTRADIPAAIHALLTDAQEPVR